MKSTVVYTLSACLLLGQACPLAAAPAEPSTSSSQMPESNGSFVDQNAQLIQQKNDATYFVAGWGGVYDPGTSQKDQEALLLRLQGDASALVDFNLVYGTSLSALGKVSAADKAVLQSVVSDAFLTPYASTFLDLLSKTAGLYRSFQSSPAARADFNLLYGTALPASGKPSNTDRLRLYKVAADPAFVQTVYLPLLTNTASLYRAIEASAVYRADFNLLYGAALPASGSPNGTDRSTLFGIVGTAGFNQAAYLSVLRESSILYSLLQKNAAKRALFNSRYETTLTAKGSPSAAGRATLFQITSSRTYVQKTFWDSLRTDSTGTPEVPCWSCFFKKLAAEKNN